MNVTENGQTVTEVGQNQGRISTATEDVLSTWTNLAAVVSILRVLLHFFYFSFAPRVSLLQI